MNWLASALKSSVGRKLIMALTGLLVCGFLIVHLGGNLLMYVGPDAYNTYAKTLHSQEWLIKIAEVGLFALFAIHIWLAMETNKENRSARPVGYAVKKSKIKDRKIPFWITPENYMLASGIIVLIFLLIHLGDFTFEVTMGDKLEGLSYFDKAIVIMRSPLSFWSYILGVLLMGWHLSHGVTSMFQTLGLRHKKYDPFTQSIGPIFAAVMVIGFVSFPIYAQLTPYDPYANRDAQPAMEEAARFEELAVPKPSPVQVADDADAEPVNDESPVTE